MNATRNLSPDAIAEAIADGTRDAILEFGARVHVDVFEAIRAGTRDAMLEIAAAKSTPKRPRR